MVKAMKNAFVIASVVVLTIAMIAVYSLVGAQPEPQVLVTTDDLQSAAGSEAVQPAAHVQGNFDAVLPGSALQGQ